MGRAPAQPRPGEPITLVITKSGRARYRTVLGYAPPGEPRQQRRRTFNTLSAARAHVAEVKAKRAQGVLPTRDRQTFDRLADEYLAERSPRVRAVTLHGYRDRLAYARKAFGRRPVGSVTTTDVEEMARRMAAAGLSRRTVAATLTVTRAVLDRAVRLGAAVRNVADGVEALGAGPKRRTALTLDEYRSVAAASRAHPWAAAWSLTLAGMRRSEVLGLRWQDVDLAAPAVRVRHGRTGDGPELTPPKTARGVRTVPLTPEQVVSFRALRTRMAENLGIIAVGPNAFVLVDEAGRPLRRERYSDEWIRLCHSAGIRRRVLLHEARHTAVTVLRASGQQDRIVAAVMGHDETVMRRTYDHAGDDEESLTAAVAALAALQGLSTGAV